MQVALAIIGCGCLLFGQAASETPLVRVRPPEMVAEAVKLPAGAALTGQPLTLASALTSAADRRRQFEAVCAYWDLAQAVSEYHYCAECVDSLQGVKTLSGDGSAALRLARAAAAARLRQAELTAIKAQCELARLVGLTDAAPLPADRPHVGAYRTNFTEIFAGRPAPAAMMRIERTLPIRRREIDERAAAVQAAEDVLAEARTAVEQGGQRGRADIELFVSSCRELERQRRAFIEVVCRYNRDIAEYCLTVAAPNSPPQALAVMLIGPAQQTAPQVIASQPGGVRQTSAIEPIPDPISAGGRLQSAGSMPAASGEQWKASEPTPAPPRNVVRQNEPTPAPPKDAVKPNEPTPAPPKKDAEKKLVPVESPLRTTYKLPVGGEAAASASAFYPALVGAAPAAQAKQLTAALHWDRSLPERAGRPMSLSDCLLRDAGSDRLATIAAFWRVRQQAAEYQALAQQVELFDVLTPAVLERRREPSGAVEMLRLNAAQLAAKAELRESHAALVEAQCALAQRVGAVAEADWPLAATVPHAGNYLLRLEAQPRSVAASWPVRGLAAEIPGLCECVHRQAAAVVEADAVRAAAAEQCAGGGGAVDAAIEGVAAQTEQTVALLAALTDYNLAIAEYVLAVAPPSTPADRLAAALVVQP